MGKKERRKEERKAANEQAAKSRQASRESIPSPKKVRTRISVFAVGIVSIIKKQMVP